MRISRCWDLLRASIGILPSLTLFGLDAAQACRLRPAWWSLAMLATSITCGEATHAASTRMSTATGIMSRACVSIALRPQSRLAVMMPLGVQDAWQMTSDTPVHTMQRPDRGAWEGSNPGSPAASSNQRGAKEGACQVFACRA